MMRMARSARLLHQRRRSVATAVVVVRMIRFARHVTRRRFALLREQRHAGSCIFFSVTKTETNN